MQRDKRAHLQAWLLPGGLGDTGQQGNFSTQKAQVPTPLLSTGGPYEAPHIFRLLMDSSHPQIPLNVAFPRPHVDILFSLFSLSGALFLPVLVQNPVH